jgi:hypothetical protein
MAQDQPLRYVIQKVEIACSIWFPSVADDLLGNTAAENLTSEPFGSDVARTVISQQIGKKFGIVIRFTRNVVGETHSSYLNSSYILALIPPLRIRQAKRKHILRGTIVGVDRRNPW